MVRLLLPFLLVLALAFPAVAATEVNTATAQELAKLDGLGKKTAAAIVAHREKNGPFQKIEDLDKVKGVGKGTLDKLRSQVTVNGAVPAPAKGDAKAQALAASGQKVDVNAATAAQLTKLPGIGKGKAKAIVAHREKNGPFKTVDDLASVDGISKKLVAKVRDLVVCGAP